MSLAETGYLGFPADPSVAAWAKAAQDEAHRLTADPDIRAANLRHGETWFVGVDALANDVAGALNGVPLSGPWDGLVPDLPQHKAQLSIIYPGYPQQDPDESDGNHRYRRNRCAAHVDGLLPTGPDRRRFALEYHAYILGIPLNECPAAPTVVWTGSHHIIGKALRAALQGRDPTKTDITDAYHAARREVFDSCEMVALSGTPGTSYLIHRHALHGVAPWDGPAQDEGRMVAFLRPEFEDWENWLEV